jgi:hypothetical protein
MAKRGIGPVIAALIPSVITGLMSRKDRDAATPHSAGVVRDLGLGIVAAAGTSSTVLDCSVYGLSDEHSSLVHGISLIIGFALYAFGIGKKEEKKDEKI